MRLSLLNVSAAVRTIDPARPHLELHDALVVLGGELGVLEERILHVDQVPLIRRVAVQDERHLADHRRLQCQFGQRGGGALDGCSVLSINTALEGDTR